LTDYSYEYHGGSTKTIQQDISFSQDEKTVKLYQSLSELFTTSQRNHQNYNHVSSSIPSDSDINKEALLFVVPTFQLPASFDNDCCASDKFQRSLPFASDSEVTKDIILTSGECGESSSLYLSSAYLNPTPSLISCLQSFISRTDSTIGQVNLLTASLTSHGFSPKKTKETLTYKKKECWIPPAFLQVAKETVAHLSKGGRLFLYSRNNWTFHAKGLWLLASNDHKCGNEQKKTKVPDAQINRRKEIQSNELLLTVIGSGNFGYRSHSLDVESNCILIMNPTSINDSNRTKISSALIKNWNELAHYSEEMYDESDQDFKNLLITVALQFARKFM